MKDQQAKLQKEIDQIDSQVLKTQQDLVLSPPPKEISRIEPCTLFANNGNEEDLLLGKYLIANGKVGCLIVAGGQGSRLNFDLPKGMFPVTPVHRKSLFQLFAEKAAAASKQANYPLPVAIMTSPANDAAIKAFFHEHHYFGLASAQVFFFSQKELPFLDRQGNLLLETPGSISKGPDGNGSSLRYFYESGIWKKWSDMGVEQLNYVLIDNPLADPFDAELAGYQHRTGAEATLKSILRRDANEKVGIIVKKEGKISVVEYTELPSQTDDYRLANISLFGFTLDFIRKCAKAVLPLHASLKPAKTVEGKVEAWKMETFIFDNLAFAEKVNILLYPRNECFAPLKNEDNIKEVQEALQARDIEIFKKVTNLPPPETPFELSQDFYYPTPDFLAIKRQN